MATAGSTAVTVDTSQNVGIGTSSPSYKLDVQSSAAGVPIGRIYNSTSNEASIRYTTQHSVSSDYKVGASITVANAFEIYSVKASASRMIIDSSGNLLVGTTSAFATNSNSIANLPGSGQTIYNHLNGTASGSAYVYFCYNGSAIASITQNGTTAVAYNTSSDYRLKENVTPMTTGLATISALKPVNYDWISDKSAGEGFIAHELQAIIPNAVTGEKDAVDEDGKPIHQGVDYSKIVVHLVAAIQELKAEFDAYKAAHP